MNPKKHLCHFQFQPKWSVQWIGRRFESRPYLQTSDFHHDSRQVDENEDDEWRHREHHERHVVVGHRDEAVAAALEAVDRVRNGRDGQRRVRDGDRRQARHSSGLRPPLDGEWRQWRRDERQDDAESEREAEELTEAEHRLAAEVPDGLQGRDGARGFRHDGNVPDDQKDNLNANDSGAEGHELVVSGQSREPGFESPT